MVPPPNPEASSPVDGRLDPAALGNVLANNTKTSNFIAKDRNGFNCQARGLSIFSAFMALVKRADAGCREWGTCESWVAVQSLCIDTGRIGGQRPNAPPCGRRRVHVDTRAGSMELPTMCLEASRTNANPAREGVSLFPVMTRFRPSGPIAFLRPPVASPLSKTQLFSPFYQ